MGALYTSTEYPFLFENLGIVYPQESKLILIDA